jgi:hypothetical protein
MQSRQQGKEISMRMRRIELALWGAVLMATQFVVSTSQAAQLKSETAKAFDQYVSASEKSSQTEVSDAGKFLAIDAWSEVDRRKAYTDLKQGQLIIRNQLSGKDASVPAGLIHDWTGIVFIPSATLRNTLAVLQDYDRDEDYYRPDVMKSKLLARTEDEFRVFLRLKRTYVITAVFDTEYHVRYSLLDATHAYSESVSTRIVEVENAGEGQEHEKPAGDDRGLLWRLNSYWRFYEADGGTFVQCKAISLTRDIPTGLGWMVKPFVEKVPMESLRFTLTATRKSVTTHKGATN